MAPHGNMKEAISLEERRKLLVSLYEQDKWHEILHMYKCVNNERDPDAWDCGLLWLRPSERSLQFIGEQVRSHGLDKLLSVGCGSGLLEWLIHCSTGLQVEGLEVDELWWCSRHAPPCFLTQRHLVDVEESSKVDIPDDVALLFCYFNNECAFDQYLSQYTGNCLIVAGPAAIGDKFPPQELLEGSCPKPAEGGRHCNPRPFSIRPPWVLKAAHNVSTSPGDFIAVYVR